MTKRFTDTDKYKKTFIRSLPGPYKLFWDYLYHDCNFAGIWHVDFEVAQIYLGRDMPIEPDRALELFNQNETRVELLSAGRKWFIKSFIEFQYKTAPEALNPSNKVHASVLAALKKEGVGVGATLAPCKGHASPMQAPTLGAKDKDKDKDGVEVKKGSTRGNKFSPPLPADVSLYAESLGFDLDADHFCNWYASKGWKVGNSPMRDWQAAVRTWKSKRESNGQDKPDWQ